MSVKTQKCYCKVTFFLQFPSRERRRNPVRTCRGGAGNIMAGGVQNRRRNPVRTCRLLEGSVQRPQRRNNPDRDCHLRERNSREVSVHVVHQLQEVGSLFFEFFPCPRPSPVVRRSTRRATRFTSECFLVFFVLGKG